MNAPFGASSSDSPILAEDLHRLTDLKLQKRIMAGRAGVPLLRHRVILMALPRRSYP